ncbi:MAG: hypothetical protein IJ833_02195 [Lachnospiraceae bacterium]|nr:hypothetical protein [Lachnospiraceae bacterium]
MCNISVLCIYNKRDIFESQLNSSLKEQDVLLDIVGIDNTNNQFASAAEAYNYAVDEWAKGDILIFAHQDIILKEPDALGKFAEAIMEMPIGTILGGAGAKACEKKNIGNYTSGSVYRKECVQNVSNITEVNIVDEVIFGMRRETFQLHHFDSRLCNNWHLYAAEMCLYFHAQGHSVYVFPLQFHHFSNGVISKEYMQGFVQLCDTYRAHEKYIWTTCYKVRNSFLGIRLLYHAWMMNRKLRKIIKRVK